MNPLYNQLMNSGMTNPMQQYANCSPTPGTVFQNPLQKMAYIMQAMTNPAAFVKQHFPDIPDNISGDPNQILQYLKRTRGITDEQIRSLQSQIPGRLGGNFNG